MRLVDSILMEIDQEAQTTEKILDQLPEDKLGWKPHPKSYSLGQVALHIATSPPNVAAAAVPDNFGRPNLTQAEPKSRKEILDAFSQGLEAAKATLSKMDDTKLMSTWNLSNNGKVVMSVAHLSSSWAALRVPAIVGPTAAFNLRSQRRRRSICVMPPSADRWTKPLALAPRLAYSFGFQRLLQTGASNNG